MNVLDYDRPPAVLDRNGWLTVEQPWNKYTTIFIRDFPDICCVCLGPAATRWRVPTPTSVEVFVPICETCRRRYQWRIRVVLTVCTLLAIISAVVLVVLVATTTSEAMQDAFGVIGLGAFVTRPFVVLFGSPVRIAMRQRNSPIARIRFRNPDFMKYLQP